MKFRNDEAGAADVICPAAAGNLFAIPFELLILTATPSFEKW